jgi:hypothetical protein
MFSKFMRILISFSLIGAIATAVMTPPASASEDMVYPSGIEVHAGNQYTCALNNLGAVKCWGIPNMTPPTNLGEVSYLATGNRQACAIERNLGKLVCWGEGANSNQIPADLGPIKQISLGTGSIICAITTTDYLKCWGYKSPTISAEEKSLQVSAGYDSVCSLNFAHKVDCWDSDSSKSNPLPQIKNPITKMQGDIRKGCSQTIINELHCWGYTDFPKSVWSGVLNFEFGPAGMCLQQIDIACYTPYINTPAIFRGRADQPFFWGQVSVGFSRICAVKISMTIACKDYSGSTNPRLNVPNPAPGVHKIKTLDGGVAITWPRDSFFPTVPRVLALSDFNQKISRSCTTNANQCNFEGLTNGIPYRVSEAGVPLTYEVELVDHSTTTYTRRDGSIVFGLLPTRFGSDQALIDQSNLLLLKINLGQWNWSTELSFKWFKNGVEIPNETQSFLTLKTEDMNSKFKAEITTRSAFFDGLSQTTPEVTALAPNSPCIANVDSSIWLGTPQQPSVAGKSTIGEKLTAKLGTWPKGTSFCSYWYSNGKSLASKNALEYTIPSSLSGKTIQYVVVGTPKSGSPVARFSPPMLISKKAFPANRAIAILGKSTLGSELTIATPSWTSGTTYKYQWVRDGIRVPGATKIKYKVTETDLKSSLVVEVCGEKTDYVYTCRTSPKLNVPLGQITPSGKLSVKANNSKVGGLVVLSVGKWPSGTSSRITWLRDGEVIWDESGSTYLITSQDRGHTLSVVYKVSKSNYMDCSVSLVVGRIP